ncbi:MAG: hypothetical protein IT373_25075 [Polyangiaceae bacterium]|nr:hypothetical protein [Polyangiaceae bacterium]
MSKTAIALSVVALSEFSCAAGPPDSLTVPKPLPTTSMSPSAVPVPSAPAPVAEPVVASVTIKVDEAKHLVAFRACWPVTEVRYERLLVWRGDERLGEKAPFRPEALAYDAHGLEQCFSTDDFGSFVEEFKRRERIALPAMARFGVLGIPAPGAPATVLAEFDATDAVRAADEQAARQKRDHEAKHQVKAQPPRRIDAESLSKLTSYLDALRKWAQASIAVTVRDAKNYCESGGDVPVPCGTPGAGARHSTHGNVELAVANRSNVPLVCGYESGGYSRIIGPFTLSPRTESRAFLEEIAPPSGPELQALSCTFDSAVLKAILGHIVLPDGEDAPEGVVTFDVHCAKRGTVCIGCAIGSYDESLRASW